MAVMTYMKICVCGGATNMLPSRKCISGDRQSQCPLHIHTHKKLQDLQMLSGITLDCQVTMIVMNSGFQLAENSTSSQAMPCLCHGLCQCIWFCHCLCNCLLVGLKFLKSGKSCDSVNCKCESNCPHDEEL